MNNLKDEYWKILGNHTLLVGIESAREAQEKNLILESLPELFEIYARNPKMLYLPLLRNTNILTGTNEILGVDFEGKIYGNKNNDEKVIVNTHGINISEKQLSAKKFTELLSGYFPGSQKPVPVYDESRLKRIGRQKINYPCISVIRAETYLKEPAQYCNDLEHLTIEGNFLLASRTMKNFDYLSEFIAKATYFGQTYPLIEPPVCSKFQDLFSKYAYRVLPLILSDGEIIKEAKDTTDFFGDIKPRKNSTETVAALKLKYTK